jgi:hypothetical protein
MSRHTWCRASLGRNKHRSDTPGRAHSGSRSGRIETHRVRGPRNPRRTRRGRRGTRRGMRLQRRPGSPRMRPYSFRSGCDPQSDPYRPRCTRLRRTAEARTIQPRRHFASSRRFPLPSLPNQNPRRMAVRARRRAAAYDRRPNKIKAPVDRQVWKSARLPHRQGARRDHQRIPVSRQPNHSTCRREHHPTIPSLGWAPQSAALVGCGAVAPTDRTPLRPQLEIVAGLPRAGAAADSLPTARSRLPVLRGSALDSQRPPRRNGRALRGRHVCRTSRARRNGLTI